MVCEGDLDAIGASKAAGTGGLIIAVVWIGGRAVMKIVHWAQSLDDPDPLKRDKRGNIIAGTGPGKGPALTDAESQALQDAAAGKPFDQATLNAAKQKIKTQEKYAKVRNKRKRNP